MNNHPFLKTPRIPDTDPAAVTERHIKKSHTHDGRELVSVNIRCPVISGTPKSAAINRFYTATADAFAAFAEGRLRAAALKSATARGEGFRPYAAVMSYKATHNAGVLCIALDFTVYTGEPRTRGEVTRRVQLWELHSGTLLPPSAFTRGTPGAARALRAAVSAAAGRERRRRHTRITDDDAALHRHLERRNLMLTADGIAFFFPQGTIAGKEEGIAEIEIKA
jgi:hypothetical protein